MPEMLVRLKKGKKIYEVMVHEGMVMKYREGEIKRLEDVVVAPTVFLNATKGTRASAEQLKESFGTDDMNEIIEIVIQNGEAQESAGERKDKQDAKRHEIITAIQKNYSAPDGKPLPVVRIENALQQAKIRVDVDADATRQVTTMFPKLSTVLPMKKKAAEMEGIITVPTKLAGVVSSTVRKHGTVQRETYGAQAKFEIEIDSYDLLMKDLTKATKGEFEFTITNQSEMTNVGADATASNSGRPGGKKGKKKGKK